MVIVRNVFCCKPGEAKELMGKSKAAGKAMKSGKVIGGYRVMTDIAATYWTVVFETEHASLEACEKAFAGYGASAKVQKAMEGYMDQRADTARSERSSSASGPRTPDKLTFADGAV
jgi:hypothetical protein